MIQNNKFFLKNFKNVVFLGQSEIFENNYLLVEDKSVNKNIFQHIPNSYISVKI